MTKFIKKQSRAKNCPLCAAKAVLDYKDVQTLRKYVSDRGKIMGRARTGICAKHQRQVTSSVKRARFMALLPFSQA